MREGPIKVRTHTTNLTSNSRVSDKAVKGGLHKQGQTNQIFDRKQHEQTEDGIIIELQYFLKTDS